MRIVSVQDISCLGQCSLTAALPVLSAYGIETAILPSGILSTHTGGFTGFTVLDLTEEMNRIVDHWKQEKLTFDAIYTGYIGDARQFDTVRGLRELLNAGGKLIVDPAMADNGKLYGALNEEIVVGMRGIVREADIILPNLTEAAFLLDEPYQEAYSHEEILSMLHRLADMGPETVILTGVSDGPDRIGAAAYRRSTDTVTEYYAERQSQSYHGTGDLFSAIAIAGLLKGRPISEVLEQSCEFIVRCIRATVDDPSHFYGVKFEEVLAEGR